MTGGGIPIPGVTGGGIPIPGVTGGGIPIPGATGGAGYCCWGGGRGLKQKT